MCMKCLKADSLGESPCEWAKPDMMRGYFVCNQDCCRALAEQLRAAENAEREAREKLEKYRAAIMPFYRNCKEVVDIIESSLKEAK